ncbi:hypothetical protein [Streptomyces sp. CA-111067]|uniref:hypothetical protein n=1 Tax=Streptomyces sp. CA-111067 TaxID=3240046 RepID=UPI003D995D31
MSQKALGRSFNIMGIGDGKYVNMREAGGIAFSCYLAAAAGDTYTLVQAKDSAGTGAKNLVAVTDYYTCTGDGTDTWTHRTQAAAATVVTAASAVQNHAVFEVEASQLDDGFTHVKVTSTGAGLVTPIPRDLMTQRDPANLKALSA